MSVEASNDARAAEVARGADVKLEPDGSARVNLVARVSGDDFFYNSRHFYRG